MYCLQVLSCLILLDLVESEAELFKLGLLTPWNDTFEDFSGLTSASAVSIAIEHVHSDPTLSDKIKFE